MATDDRTLQLSDIIIVPSPTPEPQPRHDDPSPDLSPGQLDDDEVQKMQQNAKQVRESLSKGKGKSTGPEYELSEMVLRLTTTLLSLRAQLLSQADIIAHLSLQRKYLLQRMEEDKQLWDSERDGWSRVAEVLVAEANKASPNIYKEQEYGKLPAIIESENVGLRQKLANAQGRLVALENELSHLRPILLMQPYALSGSKRDHHRRKPTSTVNAEPDATDATEGEPSTPKERRRQDSQGQYYRQREGDEHIGHDRSRRSKKRSYFKRSPVLTDARAEHLLLAARRIGRRRAALLSATALQLPEPEVSTSLSNAAKGKGKATEHFALATPSGSFTPNLLPGPLPTTPKTPSKSPRHLYPPGSPGFFPPPGHAYLVPAGPSSSGRPPGGKSTMPPPFFVPGPVPGPAYAFYGAAPYPGFAPVAATPSRNTGKSHNSSSSAVSPSKSTGPSTSANRQRQQGKPAGRGAGSTSSPLTPLDKLLSAAQTVFSPSTASKEKPANPGAAVPLTLMEADETSDGSPTPKRRRTGPSTAETTESSPANLDRRASALDVLADQAIGTRTANVTDSRERSGSISSLASAASKSGGTHPQRAQSRGRGRSSSARSTKKRKKPDEESERDSLTATDTLQGRTKSTSRKRDTESRGSSLDPPINLQEVKTTSRSGTPGTGKRVQLRDIPEEDEDAPHESDAEEPQLEAQGPQSNAVASADWSIVKHKRANKDDPRADDNDLGLESEEEQERHDKPLAHAHPAEQVDSARTRAPESDVVRERWLKKLGLSGET